MSDDKNPQPAHEIDGGTPTDREAHLAAQLLTIGENPQVDPDAAPAAGADAGAAGALPAAVPAAAAAAAAAPAPAPADAPAPAPAPAAAAPASADAPAAATPPAEAPPPAASAPAPAAPPPLPERPVPPKDFDAEFEKLQKQYDDGDIDTAAYNRQFRELTGDEAAFKARVTIHDETVKNQTASAVAEFNRAASTWEKDNADFLANPLRRDAMQKAIALIDQETGYTLAPTDLLARAETQAFEAFNYKRPGQGQPKPTAEEAIAAATAARAPAPAPATLASAPAAAPIESNNGSAFAELDSKDISDLEDHLARMSAAQRDAYLRDAPGANSTLRDSADKE
ncbi:hypothetical protein [Dyella sp. 2RAB6]|uniref:hypothetical protein n=1 Tax=Dyella sp. 2RAB6 TaxID=3232992 RepID=UPI003F90BC97